MIGCLWWARRTYVIDRSDSVIVNFAKSEVPRITSTMYENVLDNKGPEKHVPHEKLDIDQILEQES